MDNKNHDKSENKFSRFYSKTNRIYIPLYNYKPFHNVSDIDAKNPNYIDRTSASKKLSMWLRQSGQDKSSGAYLITGYRGMGKSSFVGEVISSLKKEIEKSEVWVKSSVKFGKVLQTLLLVIGYIAAASILPLFLCHCYLWMISGSALLLLFLHFALKKKNFKKNKYIQYIKINIGDEIKEERDVLAIIASTISDKITYFIRNKLVLRTSYSLWFAFEVFAFSSLFSCLMFFVDWNFVTFIGPFKVIGNETSFLTRTIYAIGNACITNVWLKMPIKLFICVGISWVIVHKLFMPAFFFLLHVFIKKEVKSPYRIIKRLNQLVDRIQSSVEENRNADVPVNSSAVIGYKRSRKYQPATVREIEYELSSIINDINDSVLLNSRFIIVLDELDKLNSSNNKESAVQSDINTPSLSHDEISSGGSVSQDEKQHRIMTLLSKIKYFTSNSESKFVFIAGRELYDAYLADVSDRDFTISSMFDGVLNLNSFLSSDTSYKSVTRMTKAYVIKAIMPGDDKWAGKKRSEEKRSETDQDKYGLGVLKKALKESGMSDSDLSPQIWEGTFQFLRQFITYLTFTSNGAPKKLVSQFEKYIISRDEFDKDHEPEECISFPKYDRRNKPEYYLRFGYRDKEKIGFIHYLAQPVFYNIMNQNSDYDDKLLVTSLFLISHLYKHHGSGFSWRNLEYIPELIESSKTPELRKYINGILTIMERMDLTFITSGIYTNKFSKSLVEEISFLSRRHEELSSFFNFSLNYFKSVKQYFYKLLSFYSTSRCPEVTANIHGYLGDIHMAGEEYTEAVTHFRIAADLYKTAIQRAKKDETDNDMSFLVVRYTNSMLKLGLAYEKRNTFGSAYLVYNSLTELLIDYRHVEERVLGLERSVVYDKKKQSEYHDDNIILYDQSNTSVNTIGARILHPGYITEKETDKLDFWMYGGGLTEDLRHHLLPVSEHIISKLAVFEDLRIAYLSVLAKLFSLEKKNISGVQRGNIELAVAEFEYMYILTDMSSKYLLAVDFYRKLGDILYYKNNNYYASKNSWDNFFSSWSLNVKHKVVDFLFSQGKNKSQIEPIIKWFDEEILDSDTNSDWSLFKNIVNGNDPNPVTTFLNKEEMRYKMSLILCPESESDLLSDVLKPMLKYKRFSTMIKCAERRKEHAKGVRNDIIPLPCTACQYYNKSLMLIAQKLLDPDKLNSNTYNTKAMLFVQFCSSEKIRIYSTNEIVQTALTLEAMANVMLSCSYSEELLHMDLIVAGLDLKSQCKDKNLDLQEKTCKNAFNEYVVEITKDDSKITKLDRAVLYLISSIRCYQLTGDFSQAMHCTIKLSSIISQYIKIKGCPTKADFEKTLHSLETLTKEIIRDMYAAKGYNAIIESSSFQKSMYSEHGKDILFGMTFIMPDIEELVLCYYRLKLLFADFNKESDRKLIACLYNAPSLGPNRNSSLSVNRIQVLKFKADLNKLVYEQLDVRDYRVMHGNSTISGYKCNKLIEQIDSKYGNQPVRRDFMKFLITDSIFCLTNIVTSMANNQSMSIFTNLFWSGIYSDMSEWVERKKEFAGCDEELEKLLDHHSIKTLDIEYLKEKSDYYYQEALQMHTEGSSYRNMISNFYILDDDLQNNTSQFYIAYERYKLRSIPKENPDVYKLYSPERFI